MEDYSEDSTKTSFIDYSLNGDILPIRQDEDWMNTFIGIMNIELAIMNNHDNQIDTLYDRQH